jgi:hypothetical protein
MRRHTSSCPGRAYALAIMPALPPWTEGIPNKQQRSLRLARLADGLGGRLLVPPRRDYAAVRGLRVCAAQPSTTSAPADSGASGPSTPPAVTGVSQGLVTVEQTRPPSPSMMTGPGRAAAHQHPGLRKGCRRRRAFVSI